MTKTCPKCGTIVDDNAKYCTNPNCDYQFKNTGAKTSSIKEGGTEMFQAWVIILSILELIGLVITIFGFWMIGLPIIIAAGFYASSKGQELIPKLTIILVGITLKFINLLPENNLLSVFAVTIGLMGVILLMPEHKKGEEWEKKQKAWRYPLIYGGLIFVAVWTWYNFNMSEVKVIIAIEFITVPLVIASIIWKQPISAKSKAIGTFFCFLPLIGLGLNFLFVAGGAIIGGQIESIQHTLSQGGLGGTGTVMDMILNPKLAVQAQLKPATTKEVKTTEAAPTIAFTVSGESLPKTGCYDSSTFQIFGKVKNTGTKQITDLKLTMSKNLAGLELDTPCDAIDTTNCEWNIYSIPISVTTTKNCMIGPIPSPTEIEGVAKSHSCFINIIATTGYHSVARLPVSIIDRDYAINKLEQRQLTTKIIPSTTGIGPIEFAIGGFEQPILMSDSADKIALRTSISNTGNGEVGEYKSIYMYIPNKLLEKVGNSYQCYDHDNADWACLNEINCNGLTSQTHEKDYCEAFIKFKDEERIGNYRQAEYDNSDELLKEGYSICFYKKSIDEEQLANTGVCNIKPDTSLLSDNELRKTLIIRGDVLYTYNVKGEVTIMLQDCSI